MVTTSYASIAVRSLCPFDLLHKGASRIPSQQGGARCVTPDLGAISKRLKCPPIRIGGWEDHVHVLARLPRTIMQADWVKEVKRVSNLWMKEQGPE
jgi:hypothetical protein